MPPVIRDGRSETHTDGIPQPYSVLARVAIIAAILTLGCDSKSRCSANEQCPSGYACQQNQCISVVSGRTLGIEILPPPNDSLSARTERPNLAFLGSRVPVVFDATTLVSGTVVPLSPPTTMYSADAHVQVTIPSRLPGRADQQITTEMAMNQFMFGVGSSRLGTVTATFLFTPGSTNSQSQPPIPLSAQLEPTLQFTFPPSDQMTVIHGQLVDDQHNPLAGYLARALARGPQGQQVSNTFPTLSDGTFALLIPPDAVPPANDAIVLTLTPPAKTLVPPSDNQPATTIVDLPQFVSGPVPLKTLATSTTPSVYVLPAFIPATAQPPFSFAVAAEGEPQSGVSMRFTMNVALSTGGTAFYQASATSDSSGLVNVPLVPGTVTQPVSYQVMIQGRDAMFKYASQCNPALAWNFDAAGNPPLPVTFTMTPKVQLSGSVSDSMSAPAVNAQVVATQISGVTDCGSDATAPPAASSKTGAGGEYTLRLDPGTYRIEVDPPPSTMVNYPRTILDGADAVTVSSTVVHNIPLPPGNVAMGVVVAPDGVTPVPMASVEIFEVFCREANCGAVQAPVSLAQVTTDDMGNFQTVLPALP